MSTEELERRVSLAERQISTIISGANHNKKIIERGFEDVRRDIKHIKEDIRGLDDRFDSVDSALVAISERITALETRVASVEQQIQEGFAFQQRQIASLRDQMEGRFESFEAGLKELLARK